MDKFESKLMTMPSGCIEWTGYTIKSNGRESHRYGRLKVNGRDTLAHRHAYRRVHGAIPDGLQVLHSCDNTRCCNVNHLFLGTHADNMADRGAKGRCRSKPPAPARGEAATGSKLNDQQVLEIRRLRADGPTTVALSRKFQVHTSVISRVANRKTWTHL